METKQIIVIRKDLNMRKGKMVAQGAHASMKVLLDYAIKIGEGRTFVIDAATVNPIYHWLNGSFTKIVVGCDSEDELFELASQAGLKNIRHALVEDRGLTEFHGKATYTALAIGPEEVKIIDEITKHLKLL